MKSDFTLLGVLFFILSISGCFSGEKQLAARGDPVTIANSTAKSPTPGETLLMFTRWSACGIKRENDCLVNVVDMGTNDENDTASLRVTNGNGETLYQESFDNVQNVFPSYVLRTERPQLVIFASKSGSTVVRILDYENAKVTDLLKSINSDNFGFMAEVRPQFRSGINPAIEPYEVLLTGGIGLASPVEKYTTILRWHDNRFQVAGRFQTSKVGNCIESYKQGHVQ